MAWFRSPASVLVLIQRPDGPMVPRILRRRTHAGLPENAGGECVAPDDDRIGRRPVLSRALGFDEPSVACPGVGGISAELLEDAMNAEARRDGRQAKYRAVTAPHPIRGVGAEPGVNGVASDIAKHL
jgi:hypothetical protein